MERGQLAGLPASGNGGVALFAQAEAALRPPGGVVLHQEWVATTTSAEFACTVRHRPSEVWIDQAPPHRYRVRRNDAPPPRSLSTGRRALACWTGTGTELGGLLDADETLEFAPPNELRSAGARYEELPRTAASLALADIRAQHPRATGP